jgi:hypothetical protein
MPKALTAEPAVEPLLQVVGPEDNWVLERLARTLATKLPYAAFVPWAPRPTSATRLAYYINYALFDRPSGLLDVVFFTHPDEAHQSVERARRADACVCMASQYVHWLATRGVREVTHIPMGFDWYTYRPRLVLAVVGRLEHPRKGRDLVEQVRALPFVEIVTTEGRKSAQEVREVYQRADYVFIPATVEGGPLCLLEGLALGKPVIAPEGVGMIPEFSPTPQIRIYPTGDARSLVRLLTDCYREKETGTRLVRDRTWDRWAERHHHYFLRLLRGRGLPVPIASPGFRFGMLGELDVPPGLDVTGLEAALDQASRWMYFGQYAPAREILQSAVQTYPFVRPLLAGLPG